MSDELVRVRDLKKIFSVPAGELHAVDGVDFSIARGSTIGIVGESGCGKSTMGRLLAMLLEATSGEILFDGQNIAKKMSKAEAMAYKKRIQMIFQDPFSSLNPRMTTFETIIEPLNIHRAGTLQEREARVYQLMETVGLSERFVNAYPHELDGGRRQRIGIARALALDPEFIICDEPVSALDVSIQAQILNLLKRLQQQNGYTYLFITHDLAVVKHISNEVLVMYPGPDGRKSADGRAVPQSPAPIYTGAALRDSRTESGREKAAYAAEGRVDQPYQPKACVPLCAALPLREGAVPLQRA